MQIPQRSELGLRGGEVAGLSLVIGERASWLHGSNTMGGSYLRLTGWGEALDRGDDGLMPQLDSLTRVKVVSCAGGVRCRGREEGVFKGRSGDEPWGGLPPQGGASNTGCPISEEGDPFATEPHSGQTTGLGEKGLTRDGIKKLERNQLNVTELAVHARCHALGGTHKRYPKWGCPT